MPGSLVQVEIFSAFHVLSRFIQDCLSLINSMFSIACLSLTPPLASYSYAIPVAIDKCIYVVSISIFGCSIQEMGGTSMICTSIHLYMNMEYGFVVIAFMVYMKNEEAVYSRRHKMFPLTYHITPYYSEYCTLIKP